MPRANLSTFASDLTGSLFSPKVAMKVLGSDGESTLKDEASATLQATVDKARDSLKNVASRELDKGKQKAAAAAQKAADSLKVIADKKIKEATDKATQAAKDKLGQEVGGKLGQKRPKGRGSIRRRQRHQNGGRSQEKTGNLGSV